MFELNEKVIKKYTTPIIFHRGTNIYLQNNVTVIRQEDQDSDMKNIEGNVNSFEEKKSLKVKVNIDFIKENMSFDCECSDFKNSEKQKACKHIVALYLRFIKGEPKVVQIAFSFNNSIEADTNTERISLKNNQEADAIKAEVIHKGASNSADEKLVKDKSLIKEKKAISNEAVLSKNKLKTTLRKALNVKVQLIHLFYKKEKSTSMEIEMGESKTYKIEDIRGFLLALKRKGNYYVNDSFTFNPEKHSFKKEDISLIKIIAARNKLGNEKYAGKTVYLDSKEINDALQVLKLKNFDLVLEDKQYENIKIIKQDIPLEFEIKQETEKVILKQLNEMPVALNEDKDVFFFRGSIFIPSVMQAYRYLPFYEEFMSLEKTEKVYIDKDIERACSLLEFKLKDISEKIKVIKPEKNKMPVFPLKARVEIVTSSKGLLARPFLVMVKSKLHLQVH